MPGLPDGKFCLRVLCLCGAVAVGLLGMGPASSGESAVLLAPLPELASQRVPAIARDPNGGLLVAWMDNRNDTQDLLTYDVFMTKLAADGSRLWGGDLRVDGDPSGASQLSPRIAIDQWGTACVVWRDRRNGDMDVYMQRVSPQGRVLWPEEYAREY